MIVLCGSSTVLIVYRVVYFRHYGKTYFKKPLKTSTISIQYHVSCEASRGTFRDQKHVLAETYKTDKRTRYSHATRNTQLPRPRPSYQAVYQELYQASKTLPNNKQKRLLKTENSFETHLKSESELNQLQSSKTVPEFDEFLTLVMSFNDDLQHLYTMRIYWRTTLCF